MPVQFARYAFVFLFVFRGEGVVEGVGSFGERGCEVAGGGGLGARVGMEAVGIGRGEGGCDGEYVGHWSSGTDAVCASEGGKTDNMHCGRHCEGKYTASRVRRARGLSWGKVDDKATSKS